MKKLLLIAFLAGVTVFNSVAQDNYKPTTENLAQREHFQDMRFGLFIHWGIYSILGDGEWVMHNRNIPYNNYKRLADFFNPQQFNAKEWVAFAKRAGMKYITITARHHDGFSMFGTKASPYNIVDATPYHHDPIMDLAQECQKQGIELHIYYSLLDWGRADYAFGSPIVNGVPVNGNWDSYINFMKTQLTEFITNYPGVKGIWFDGNWERPEANWHYDDIYGTIHHLNSAILIGNNHHLATKPGEDFQMFERDLPGSKTSGFNNDQVISPLPLESCETINDSWGFNINDRKYKTTKKIIHYLASDAGLNANLLLNIGPMPNGKIQPEFADTLARVGDWLQKYGESIYGTRGSSIPPQPWGTLTVKDKIIYAHILTMQHPYVFIPGLKSKVLSAETFDGKKVKFKQQAEGLFIYTDEIAEDSDDTVVKLEIMK